MSKQDCAVAARYLVSAKHHRMQTLERLTAVSDLVSAISALVHELQKERGCWNVYLGSGGRSYADEIRRQSARSEVAERRVRAGFDALDATPQRAAIITRTGATRRDLDTLPRVREDARTLALSSRDTIAAFSRIIDTLLAVVSEAINVDADGDIAQRLIALFNFMQGKEFAGQERATGVAAFSAGRFDPAQHRRFLHLIAAQHRCFHIFDEHVPHDLRDLHATVVSGPWSGAFDRMRRIARDGGLSGALDGVSGAEWFETATWRIEAMKRVEDHVATGLGALCADRLREAEADFRAPVPGGLRVRLAAAGARRHLVGHARWERRLAAAVRGLAVTAGAPAVIRDAVGRYRGARGGEESLATQQREERRMAEERRQALEDAVHDFGASSDSVVSSLMVMARRMNESAARMTGNADAVSRRASSMAQASRDSLSGVHTVARAAEDLSATIRDLSRQAAQSLRASQDAAAEVGRTNDTTNGLHAAADRIGEVVGLIQLIATRTNLLALNATIEAARAGDAGRGFGVVASEVKALANQTAGATDDIIRQVASIQAVSSEVVGAMDTIRGIVAGMETAIAQIAAGLAQQEAATNRIAVAIHDIAAGTGSVSDTVGAVADAAADNGATAAHVLGAAADLESLTRSMRENLEGFMAKVRVGAVG